MRTILPVENRACLLVIPTIYRHLIFPHFIISYYRCFPQGEVVLNGARFCSALHSRPQDDYVLAIMRGSRKASLDEQEARGHPSIHQTTDQPTLLR